MGTISITEYLIQELDGQEFETYQEYEDTVKAILYDMESEIGKVERWACSQDEKVIEDLGVHIKEGWYEN